MPISQSTQPVQGRRAISGTPVPIAQVTKTSGSPTYTTSRVTDSVAWDLSDVENGMVVEVVDPDGQLYCAAISNVDDANNFVEHQGWIKGGTRGQKLALMRPTSGQAAIIHKVDKCKRLLIDAHDSNVANAFLGFDSAVTVDSGANPGHPIAANETQANHRVEIEAGLGDYIDLKRTYVIGSAGSDELCWIAM